MMTIAAASISSISTTKWSIVAVNLLGYLTCLMMRSTSAIYLLSGYELNTQDLGRSSSENVTSQLYLLSAVRFFKVDASPIQGLRPRFHPKRMFHVRSRDHDVQLNHIHSWRFDGSL